MKIRINKLHWPVTVLGHGCRVGIWLQGCSIGCANCCSRDTWSQENGADMTIEQIVGWIDTLPKSNIDGITITGGEPFQQADELYGLMSALQTWRSRQKQEIDILCYSGMNLKILRKNHARILNLLDVIIPEPYVKNIDSEFSLTGSGNQLIVTLSDIGISRYSQPVEKLVSEKKIQFQVDGNRIWMIGIPRSGDLERLGELCREQGLIFEGASWHHPKSTGDTTK